RRALGRRCLCRRRATLPSHRVRDGRRDEDERELHEGRGKELTMTTKLHEAVLAELAITLDEKGLNVEEKLVPGMSAIDSPYEGYAFLKDRLDSLWTEVKHEPLARVNEASERRERLRHQALMLAAVAVRFAIDVGEGNCRECGKRLRSSWF